MAQGTRTANAIARADDARDRRCPAPRRAEHGGGLRLVPEHPPASGLIRRDSRLDALRRARRLSGMAQRETDRRRDRRPAERPRRRAVVLRAGADRRLQHDAGLVARAVDSARGAADLSRRPAEHRARRRTRARHRRRGGAGLRRRPLRALPRLAASRILGVQALRRVVDGLRSRTVGAYEALARKAALRRTRPRSRYATR